MFQLHVFVMHTFVHTLQAYRLRLDVLLRVRGNRRSVDQIHRALVTQLR